MIPAFISLFFDRCQRGEAAPSEYARAMDAIDAAFACNQSAASKRARALRADGVVDRVRPVEQRKHYTDRQRAAAGDA